MLLFRFSAPAQLIADLPAAVGKLIAAIRLDGTALDPLGAMPNGD
jgi:hypothetical protein